MIKMLLERGSTQKGPNKGANCSGPAKIQDAEPWTIYILLFVL